MSSYKSKYKTFIFENASFGFTDLTATFRYSFDGERQFEEKVTFSGKAENVDAQTLQSALDLCFLLVGISYYKAFPTPSIKLNGNQLDAWQAAFATRVYTHGLSQFLYENDLTPDILPVFPEGKTERLPADYKGQGVLALQSGGKDSLLTAALLEKQGKNYTPWYMPYSQTYPAVLDSLATPPRTIERQLDTTALKQAQADGGLNGHVPITYIVMSFALVDAILHGEDTVLVSIGAEGVEPHAHIGELPVNHQWAKSWTAEQLFAEYVRSFISPDIKIGSPLRKYSELRVAELFAEHAWPRFGHDFSSCNLVNYSQGSDNRQLKWDGTCPKCANAFLLFTPFIKPEELEGVIGGNLLRKASLTDTYKGLLGIGGHMKPLECVGEIGELRLAYHMARQRWGEDVYALPFDVPPSDFDYKKSHDMQGWAGSILK